MPLRAATYCYIYPIPSLQLALESLHLARNEWAFALLLGGFAYFDEAGGLLAVNAVTLATSTSGLALVGHPVTPDQSEKVVHEMTKQGRLIPPPADWIKGGFKSMAWVHPSEKVAGKLITTVGSSLDYNHGAFLFECKHETILYALVPVFGPTLQLFKKQEAKAVLERKRAMMASITSESEATKLAEKYHKKTPILRKISSYMVKYVGIFFLGGEMSAREDACPYICSKSTSPLQIESSMLL